MSTGLYYDFHFPLSLMQFVFELLGWRQKEPNTPQIEVGSADREWFSQPRVGSNPTTEVISIQFKLPFSISEIGFEALRVPCHIECWYQDRSNNWRQMLDPSRIPVAVDVSGSEIVSWYKYHAKVYPIVAKQVQIRLTRKVDPVMGNQPYIVGLKNTLIRRNVYTRQDGTQAFEDEQDPIGNVIAKYIKDWDAPKAIDNSPTTFWRSAPQPDPAAVVSLYLDVRTKDGTPQTIDRLYIDPVYTGQMLNLYYSSDDTVGTRKLNPITLPPDTDLNTTWQLGRGRWDSSTGTDESQYEVPVSWGPLIGQSMWVGIEWSPDFAATDTGPANNPVLFSVTPDTVTTGVFTPTIYYDVGAGAIVFELTDGTDTETHTALFDTGFAAGDSLRIVVGWNYGPDSIYISVVNKDGVQVALLEEGAATVLYGGDPAGLNLVDTVDGGTPDAIPTDAFDGGAPDLVGGGTPITLPANISLDGHIGFRFFHGLLSAVIIKQESYIFNSANFQANPGVYVSPDPVIPDLNGHIPATTLDNAIYAVDFALQTHGTGGSHNSHFDDKEWTPIWKDYVTEKGMCFFPQQLSMKYLKMEFTNLTEEPYPVYDAGVTTTYKVYPISVQQQSSMGPQIYTEPGGFLGLGQVLSVNGIRSVNWLNPGSVLNAINAVLGNTVTPVSINVGTPFTEQTLPNTDPANISESYRLELGNTYIYRREALNPYILAQDQYYTTIKAEGLQKLQPFTDVPWQAIEQANQGAIAHTKTLGALPIQGTDWWIFPGQTLKIPASVMTQLTAGDVVRDFKLTLEHRVRFQTTSVHRYDLKTVTRDASMAYFAGIREVQPFAVSYIPGEDRPEFRFTQYDPTQWVFNNVDQIESGPITVDDALTGEGTAFKDFVTTSTFAKVKVDFQDSGVLKSDNMWANADPGNTNIPATQLAYYTSTIPSTIPAGFWGDHFAEWSDSDTAWGEPHSVISISIDGNRQYQGKRVLHFSRDAGAAEAGIKVVQTTHMVPNAYARLGAVFYKPLPNNNQIIVRLRRVSDGVYIYTETIVTPAVGYWYEFQTKFFELPDVEDQEYTVELVLSGDDADELYLSDLYTEVSHIRYFIRLGDISAFLHEVTDLRFADSAVVSTTTPVNEFSIQTAVLSGEAFAYGLTATPQYLK